MTPTPPDQDQIPPPPRFAVDVDLGDDEQDVDLDLPLPDEGAEQLLDRDTQVEGITYLGDYPTIPAYLRAQLEDQVSAPCQWILDCLDYAQVQRRFEIDGSRLVAESGCVYRLAAPEPVEPDPAGPWMPMRGV